MTPTPPSQQPLRQPAPGFAPNALALLPFDAALFVVSNYLAEARLASDVQDVVESQKLYAAAEACAVRIGENLKLANGLHT